jgi:sulfate adenylyltransferase
LLNTDSNAGLIAPHGGSLVDRVIREIPDDEYIKSLPKITLDQDKQMDVEQIAIGTFSPIEGFMGKEDFNGVLDNMRLANGEVWTIPIVLDVAKDFSDIVQVGNDIALWDDEGPMGLLHLEEKYEFDKDETNQKLYGTTSEDHPGVKWINNMQPVLLGGKISLLRRRTSEHKEYELTPRQVRRMFHEKGWSKIVGFHTRNVIHRSHEFIQLDAMARGNCDGLFVHPVIGKKKPGDFHAKYIINGYEQMVSDFYPKDKVVFATYATFSRYAGPREAIFTALCRKNFGCSHFVVGRDHTGVGNFYHPKAAHEIFDKFDDLDIRPVRFDQIFYSKKLNQHVHEADDSDHTEEEKMHISGTQARKMIEKGEQPPEWFMRPEISQMILNASNSGEEVFVSEKEDNNQGNVLWFTGLSGSGKTTIAQELKKSLEAQGKSVAMLDGDDVRNSRKVKLGFSREDIRENNKIIAEMAKEKSLDHDFVIVPIISPYQEDRNMVRTMIGNNYYSVYINASLDTCIKRDVKGLYSRALKGEIDNFIGISPSNPYETPQESDLVVDTAIHEPIASTQRIVEFLKQKNLLQMKLPNSSFSPEMSTAINAAFKAGEQVMQIYNTQFSYTLKDGKEPVTEADIASDKIIHMLLSSTGIPILSEETQDTGERLNQNQVWIVDPLDGTKDFVTKTGEFSIMIALVNNGVPEIGVVYNPVKDILYIAQLGKGAFKRENGDWQKMSVNNHDDLQKAKAVVSRHHLTDKEESFLNRLGVSDFVQKGSAGLKIAEVAVGKAELYFTMSDKLQEWDTAAAYCILIEAQGTMTDMLGNKLAYNQSDLYHKRGILVTNALLHNSVVEMQAVYR